MARRIVLTAVFLVTAWWTLVPPTAAHGVLEGSSPSANASLRTPPRELILALSEAVDPAFTSVVVLDANGLRRSGLSRVSADGRKVTVPLQPLPDGIYTVRWRVLSAVDGHTTTGVYTFAVGVEAPGASAVTPASASPARIAARWISYAAALLLVGAALFAYFIARPAAAVAEPHLAVSIEEIVASAVRRLSVPVAVGLMFGLGAELVLQTSDLFDASMRALVTEGRLQAVLTGTRLGWSILLQAAMAAVLLIPPTRRGRVFRMSAVIWAAVVGGLALVVSNRAGVTASQHFLHVAALLLVGTVYGLISVMAAIILPLVPDLRLPQGRWAPPAAGAILLAGITMNSHAAGVGWVAMAADWIHLAAAATWVGGLATLIVTLRMTSPDLRLGAAQALVPRTSTFAGFSLLALVVTGSYSAWLHIPAWSGFLVTSYGRTLLLKLLLIAPWLGLGAFNHFVMRPRLAPRGADRTLLRRFVRVVGGEVALAGAVLLTVAVLTITPPARVTMPAAETGGLVLAGISGEMRVTLTISPAQVGRNTYLVALSRTGVATRRGRQVQLRLIKLDEEVTAAVDLEPAADGTYRGAGVELGLGGWWRVDVLVRERGRPGATLEFPLYVGGAGGSASDPAAARLLAMALERAEKVVSWREVEQITDGRGGVVLTRYDFAAPDRMAYSTSSGTEAILIGTTRYVRNGSAWTQDTLTQPITVGGPYFVYLRGADQAQMGRQADCGREPCRIVLWQAAAAAARLAGWIGTRSHLVYRMLMVAPQHYMTSKAYDVDAPVKITPPK